MKHVIAGAGLVAAAFFAYSLAVAQPPQTTSGKPRTRTRAEVEAATNSELQMARKQLADATTEAEREAATARIRANLGLQFSMDLSQRKEQLESLKKQLADTDAILTKRADAKQSIIDLRLKVLIDEAMGIGWTEPKVIGTLPDPGLNPIQDYVVGVNQQASGSYR